MEKHFLSEIVEEAGYVERSSDKSSPPWYNPHGDCIVYQAADEAVVAERVDEFLTIFRSAIDNRPIGFQIKDVMALLQEYGKDTLRVEAEVEDGTLISVKALCLAAYERTRKSIHRRKAYASLPLPEPDMDAVRVEPPADEVCSLV